MYYHLARSRFIYYLLAHSFIVTLIKIVKKATKALRRREILDAQKQAIHSAVNSQIQNLQSNLLTAQAEL